MIAALREIEVLTLFVEDLPAAEDFYRSIFAVEVIYRDNVCLVVKLGQVSLNLLLATEAHELMKPAAVAGPGTGSRLLLTVKVEDVNAVCAELDQHGVKLLNGPIDRPWGRRTAAFADPAGNVWEVAQELPLRPTSAV